MTQLESQDKAISLKRILDRALDLEHLASMKLEGRELPSDAKRAVGLLEELIKDVKLAYGITTDDFSQQT